MAGTLHVTEQAFMQNVIALARLAQWKIFHVYDSRRSPAGFPDVLMVRDTTMLCVELKTAVGRVTPAQAAWLTALGAVQHVTAAVWRPSDWADIERRLLQVVNSSEQGVFGAR